MYNQLPLSLCSVDQPTIQSLQKLFAHISALDIDDSKIDPAEFAHALGLDRSCFILQRIFDRFNPSDTNRMTVREFVLSLSQLSSRATEQEKIDFSFGLYDINRDGTIDGHELRKLLNAALSANTGAELELTDSQIEEVVEVTLQEMDVDGNGVIDKHEYENMVKRCPRLLAPFTIDINKILRQQRKSAAAASASASVVLYSETNRSPDSSAPQSAASSGTHITLSSVPDKLRYSDRLGTSSSDFDADVSEEDSDDDAYDYLEFEHSVPSRTSSSRSRLVISTSPASFSPDASPLATPIPPLALLASPLANQCTERGVSSEWSDDDDSSLQRVRVRVKIQKDLSNESLDRPIPSTKSKAKAKANSKKASRQRSSSSAFGCGPFRPKSRVDVVQVDSVDDLFT
jgi:serine/threonine-protein phosphatase 2B regulatory subunit